MNFGVFIRSIGERTERLCQESVAQYVPNQKIHILQNYYPSYKAFLTMFELAKAHKYDWYLGLDADVILKKDWLQTFENKLNEPDTDKLFRIYFYTKDGVTYQKLVRGNNWYNGKYTDMNIKYLKKNIRIGKYWFYYRYQGLSSGYFNKPETSIRTHMKQNHNILDKTFEELIGWHGYEQYRSEIFRQYVTRYKRDPNFISNPSNEFLADQYASQLYGEQKYDQYTANRAWNQAKDFNLKHIDGRIKPFLEKKMAQLGLEEKQPLTLALDNFYSEYATDLVC